MLVAEPPKPGVYHALDVWTEAIVIGGAGGRVLHADFEYPLEAVDYKPAAIELGDATIRGIASQVYRPMLAVGDGGVVWRSEDRGETWKAVPSGTTADLHAVVFYYFDSPNPDFAVIVGDGVLLHSPDLGVTWNTVPLPVPGARLRDVLHVLGVGWFAVGLGGVILFADGDGSQWAVEASPTERDLLRVHPSYDGTDVIAVAREGELLRRDADGWTAVALDLDGEIADATAYTLAMRDGRIARRVWGTDPGMYVPTDVDEPLPTLLRIVEDSDPWDLDRTLLLAEDGRLLLLAHQSNKPVCRR